MSPYKCFDPQRGLCFLHLYEQYVNVLNTRGARLPFVSEWVTGPHAVAQMDDWQGTVVVEPEYEAQAGSQTAELLC